MEKFKNKYRIPSARLQTWDYGSHGLYFVTICTKNRQHYFGEIVVETQNFASPNDAFENITSQIIIPPETKNIIPPGLDTQNFASLRPIPIGEIAIENWNKIPEHFPFVELDEFIVMPNHVHGILFFNKPDFKEWTPNKFGPQSQNLGSVIRGYKASVTTYATTNQIEFSWQPRFHDHIIHSEEELNRIRKYIIQNPSKWKNDRDNEQGLFM